MTLQAIASARFSSVPFSQFSKYGILPVPENYAQFSVCAEALLQSGYLLDGWRGQANIHWPVESGATRRIKAHGGGSGTSSQSTTRRIDELVDQYEHNLLNAARLKGYGTSPDGASLSDLSLLATLQHYGAATRLLDFSRNITIALWFACRSHPDETGIVIGFMLDASHTIDQAEHVGKSIPVLLRNEDQKKSYRACNLAWEPTSLYERMRAQQSLFLFGPAYRGPWGSLTPYSFTYHSLLVRPPQEHSEEARRLGLYFAIAVTPQFKHAMLGHWKHLIGFDVPTLFPDLEGFSQFNSATSPLDLAMLR